MPQLDCATASIKQQPAPGFRLGGVYLCVVSAAGVGNDWFVPCLFACGAAVVCSGDEGDAVVEEDVSQDDDAADITSQVRTLTESLHSANTGAVKER